MKEATQVVTVKLPIREPTVRKKKRMVKAIKEANYVAEVASNRIMGIPRKNWSVKRPKDSWWYNWAKELGEEVSLPNEAIHQTIQSVRETYCSWQSNGYDGERPQFDDWRRVAYRGNGRHIKYYKQPGNKWFLSLPMEAGRGQRETFPLTTSNYHERYLNDIHNEVAKSADGAELILHDPDKMWSGGTAWWFHQPVKYIVDVPEPEELDNIIAVKLARWQLVTAALYPVNDGNETSFEDKEWVKFLQSGREVEHYRRQLDQKRQRLQAADQLKKVKELRGQERGYVNNVLDTVSRRVVDLALRTKGRTGVVLEDLTHVRNYMEQETRNDRRAVSTWPFRETGDKISYKSIKAGVPVFRVPTVKNSKWCANCGFEAEKPGKEGWRPNFKCNRCGYHRKPRYVNAVRNVAREFGKQHLDAEQEYVEVEETGGD